MNRATIIGRLGADPETRDAGGSQVCNLRIATTDKWTDRDGRQQERTEWHRVVVWGKQAELCQRYLNKGRLVAVEGSIESRKWTDKDGQERFTTEIKAQRVEFLDGGSGGQSDGDRVGDRSGSGDNGQRRGGGYGGGQRGGRGSGHEDIPF